MKVKLCWLLLLLLAIVVQGQDLGVIRAFTEPACPGIGGEGHSDLFLLPGEKWCLRQYIDVGLDTSTPCVVALAYGTDYSKLSFFKDWSFSPHSSTLPPGGTWQYSDSNGVCCFSYLADEKRGIRGILLLSESNGVSPKTGWNYSYWNSDLVAVVYDNSYVAEYRYRYSVSFWGTDGIRGDINGDGCVSIDDIQIYREYLSSGLDGSYIWQNFFRDRFSGGETNYGRGIILFNSPNWVDLWLLNLWLNNSTDPLVQNLGIGLLMSMELTETPIPIPTTSTLVGSKLNIRIDPGAPVAVNITASLPGKFWQKTEFVENGELTIQVPDATAKYDIEAVKLNSRLASALKEEGKRPLGFILGQNYPNPFNATTTIPYSLPKDGEIEIAVYDLHGERIITLVKNYNYRVGSHSISWNGRNERGEIVPSGIYFYRLTSPDGSICRKLLLQK